MELERGTAELYLRHAFGQMLGVADRLGDERVNERPLGPDTNAVAALIVHCCAVTEFWIGHVALGRPTARDRESEFSTTATVPELHVMVESTLARVAEDLTAMDGGGNSLTAPAGSSWRVGTSPTARSSCTCS